ncbi:hypothetical protein PTTG_09817, partial [Puccinia triticina 1-1 BBBD Race 1]
MGQLIVPELNQMSAQGFDAYDVGLQEEVLVMTPVMSFLADSPMHAKITNTPVPLCSLNPCRSCVLSAPSLLEKVTMKHLREFLQIKIYQSKRLKKKLKKKNKPIPAHLNAVIPQHIADLIKNDPNSLLNPYMELEGFDGSRHTPVEILHLFLLGVVKYVFCDFMDHLKPDEKVDLIGLWRSFNTNSLNIPSLKPVGMVKYSSSLVGKDFRVIVQAAPFIFFQFMEEPTRNIWHALCHLAPLVFQTHIKNMEEYLIELKIRIDIFLYHIIQSSAQWINKPKFHMLLHLPDSILLYGPAGLCSTEKFESYNGIVRNASVHSNRQSPGQDIAITFSSYHSYRQLLSRS